jgi:phosphoenolpyruvate---glycerone phosphotransferase subunit DhaL
MDAEVFRAWITRAAEVIEANRDHLTQLDAAIGDADHGINLARGFSAVLDALGALDAEGPRAAAPMTPGKILILTGNTIISKVGGAAGPLYGTAFRRAGKSLGSAADVDLPALSAALDAALGGVQKLGAAVEGDKTMVDALAAGNRAFSKAIAEGASQDEALSVLVEAASAGAVATIPMQALKGRASYLGPRSVGHEDPGAASTALILGALRDAARTAGLPRCARTGRLPLPLPALPPTAQLSADRTTPPRPAPRSREVARAASVTARTSSSRVPGASSRSAAPTTPIAPATVLSLDKIGAARPASPTVASWSSTA